MPREESSEVLIPDRCRAQARAHHAEPEGRRKSSARSPSTQRHHHPLRLRFAARRIPV